MRARFANRAVTVALIVILTAIAVFAVGVGILLVRGPFTRTAMADTLGDALASTVSFGEFHQTFFPHPGCVAKDVRVMPKQGPESGDAHIEKLAVQASWTGLLRHRAALLTADSIAIRVQMLGNRAFVGNPGRNIIEELDLNHAILTIGSAGEADAPRYDFQRAVLHNVAAGQPLTYKIDVGIPKPAGELSMSGDLGPFTTGAFPQTPLRGSYVLRKANLGVFSGIAGILGSKGNFSGVLADLNFTGETDVPDFEVTESRHRHHLVTRFQALVNATNGDTDLREVHASFDETSFSGTGKVASTEGEGAKTVWLDVGRGKGRIEDLMLLFVTARESPIRGGIGFRARIKLPPGPRPFKQRVVLDGDFGIGGAAFTNPQRQASANELSSRAEGLKEDQPERVLSNLNGHVVLGNGVATFSSLSFDVPGASTKLSGTYNLTTERIDLHGSLATKAELSQTTSGVKSVFLKLLNPLFKRKNAGAVIPVSVTGTYEDPQFREIITK